MDMIIKTNLTQIKTPIYVDENVKSEPSLKVIK